MIINDILELDNLTFTQKSDLVQRIRDRKSSNQFIVKERFNQELFSPYIESTIDEYVYNFSYLPTPNFLSIDHDIDCQAKGVFATSTDTILTYNEYEYPIESSETLFVVDKDQNSIQILSRMKETVILESITVNDTVYPINQQITYGINGIRLNFSLKGTSLFTFNKQLLDFEYISLLKSVYESEDIQFKLNLNGYFILCIDQQDNQNSVLTRNGEYIQLGTYVQLNITPQDTFKLSSTAITGLKKIRVSR